MARRTWCGAAVLAALLSGCGNPEVKPVPVSGTVTCDDRPLDEGTIYFKTLSTGAIDAVPIKDGRFEGKAEPGERRVEINAYRTKVLKDNPMGGEIKESLVADRYNLSSTLTATVTATGPNTFKFEVKSK